MKPQKSMQSLWKESYLSGGNDAYLETLYETYLKNPDHVSPEWKNYFSQLAASSEEVSHQDIRDYFQKLARQTSQTSHIKKDSDVEKKQEAVIDLINGYRGQGHLQAEIDPLGVYQGIPNPVLDLSYYGFTHADLDTIFDVGSFKALKKPSATLKEIHEALRKVYCGTLAIEYMNINRLEEVAWLQDRMERGWMHFQPTSEEKKKILEHLVAADGLERYIGTQYVGQKRFSLEGGDSLIPLLKTLIYRGTENGLKDIIIGMAHRGRLNVLINIIGKAPSAVFAGFSGNQIEGTHSGDVKYHMGYSSNVKTPFGPVHLALAFNPSHLEIVSPVVQGSVRSRQRRRRDVERKHVMPIQIHGDAAFAGQGVVMETFSMSQARWFTVGGSIHIVVNNQVGFTTSNPLDARSGLYCTDIAKMVDAPILHINANDPEAVFFAAQLAIDYRTQFKRDIVIDLMCYRRHGHNEADEPSATQPLMYKIIKTLQPLAVLYANKLVAEGVIDEKTEAALAERYREQLQAGQSVVELEGPTHSYEYENLWKPFIGQPWTVAGDTRLPLKKLVALAKQLEKLPEGFVLQPQVRKMMEARQKMTMGELPINWGYAETLAYATLLDEGYPIRLCGQDAGRGTFAHRHAVLYDQTSGEFYIPLSHLSHQPVQINIIDSLLSEEAVLAFEYGYACAEPNNLVLWEAQFGDFANGAQVVIDQFISSGEQKWQRLCGLVMLLPHGYEGQGPEHSSARLERYLQLCAEENMQVCIPTTPAQMYHLLRRQMRRPFRKPLIVMTPKSLLRSPAAVSRLDELADGEFQTIIGETEKIDPKKVDRVILCGGKVYYDLLEKRRELNLSHIAILRIEQLYPFPKERLIHLLASYQHVKNIVWCQEEPKNQGAWNALRDDLAACLTEKQTVTYAGRPSAASPATGYASWHQKEQDTLVMQALAD